MVEVGRRVVTDHGGRFAVVRVLGEGWALAEGERTGVRVYVRTSGELLRRIPGGGWGYRVAIHRAEDLGLARFGDVAETLRPAERLCGGWVYA